MARQSYARLQVLAFLRQVEPGRPIALYTLGRALNVLQDLTRDPRPLVQALERYRGELAAEAGAARLDTTGTGLERYGSWLDELETNLIEHYAKDRALRTLRSLVAIANHLERVPGRKNLVWVSGSFPVWIGRDRVRRPERPDPGRPDLWPEIDRAARALNRANLAVYPVDARGLMAPTEFEPARAAISREMTLVDRSGFAAMDTLAERTGGKAFYNDNDLGRAFGRAAEDSRAAYRLGYQPSHDDWNGTFRVIEIAVTRPGVRVRHRRGYFAQPDEPTDDWYRSGVLGAAMWSPVDATGMGLSVRPFPAAPDTVDLEIRVAVARRVAAAGRGRLAGPAGRLARPARPGRRAPRHRFPRRRPEPHPSRPRAGPAVGRAAARGPPEARPEGGPAPRAGPRRRERGAGVGQHPSRSHSLAPPDCPCGPTDLPHEQSVFVARQSHALTAPGRLVLKC